MLVRLGILGTASIARAFFGAPMRHASVIAIASREQSRADAFGAEFDIPRRYGSYDELLADREIEAVYIPLPQHLHCEYTIKAAQAGKHVLVEKPLALSVAEVRTMIDACGTHNVLLMEAFMYRFKRIQVRLKEIVASGIIGGITYVDFNWCFHIGTLRRSAFRMDPKTGGGALYDLGVYGVDFIRFVTNEDPKLIQAQIHRNTPTGVDVFSHAVFATPRTTATMTVAFTTDANYYTVCGEKGSVYARAALAGRSVENLLQVHLLDGDTLTEERFAPENPYINELEYFAHCVEASELPVPGGENSLKNIQLLEEVFARAAYV